jgi:hypothetical protein
MSNQTTPVRRSALRSSIVLAVLAAAVSLTDVRSADAECLNHFENVTYPCCDDPPCAPNFDTYPAHCDPYNGAEDCTFVNTDVCSSCSGCFGAYDSIKSCNASCWDCGPENE